MAQDVCVASPPIVAWDRRAAFATVLLCLVALAFWLPAVRQATWWIEDNGDRTLAIAGAERATIFEHRQFPFWNPHMYGGLPLLANPQSAFLSPSFLTVVLAGEVAGTKLRLLFALCVGLIGAWYLGRRLAEGPLAPYVTAAVFLLSSWYPLYMWRGHEEFIAFAWLPWVALFFHAGTERLRYALVAGAFLALMTLEGGIYPVPYSILLLCLYAAFLAVGRRRLGPLRALAVTFCFAAVIGGIKLLPLLDYMRDNPRAWTIPERPVPLAALPSFFLFRDQFNGQFFPTSFYGWHEYGCYVGWIALGMAFLGMVLAWRRALPWLLLTAVFLGLTMGDFGPASPWHLLHKLPVFASLHDAPRFRIVPVFCIAVMGAIGLGRVWMLLAARPGNRLRQRLFGGLCALALVALFADLYMVDGPLYGRISAYPPPPLPEAGEFQQVKDRTGHNADQAYLTFLQNKGLADNYEPMAAPSASVRGANETGYRGEVWLDDGAGNVETLLWSPNRLTYQVRCSAPARLVVNQRYEKGWRAVDGRTVEPLNGLISVRVAPQDSRVTLRYMPRAFPLGCALSLAGIGVLLWVFAPWCVARRPAALGVLQDVARRAKRCAGSALRVLLTPKGALLLAAVAAAALAAFLGVRHFSRAAQARRAYLGSEAGIRSGREGVVGEFFVFQEPLWRLPDLSGRRPDFTRNFKVIDFPATKTEFVSSDGVRTGLVQRFAARFSGHLLVDKAGEYLFRVQSDDGFRLRIDGRLVAEFDGIRALSGEGTTASVPLATGAHELRLEYFENEPDAGLQLSWTPPGGLREVVPAAALRSR